MCLVQNLRISRPLLGEITACAILPKFDIMVMKDRVMVNRFRDLALSADPRQIFQTYNMKTHQILNSKYTAVFLGASGAVFDRQWEFCMHQQTAHKLFMRHFWKNEC